MEGELSENYRAIIVEVWSFRLGRLKLRSKDSPTHKVTKSTQTHKVTKSTHETIYLVINLNRIEKLLRLQ
jgi:hypothetical protein